MPHQRLHRGKEARAGREILPAGVEISLEVHFTLDDSTCTFASRNGLSNRFSHMDQPQSLRHRYEPGSKATKG